LTQLGGNCLLRGDASGNQLQNTPEFTGSLGGSLEIPSDIGTFTLAANYYYNDGFVATADERVVQGSYNIVDASVTWRDRDGRMYVRLWGNNLTEEFFRTQLSATNSGDNGTPGAPRTYGATVGVEF
jgi:iron complex outermembrane receptor protein